MRRDIGVGTFCSWAPSTGAFEFRLMSTNWTTMGGFSCVLEARGAFIAPETNN